MSVDIRIKDEPTEGLTFPEILGKIQCNGQLESVAIIRGVTVQGKTGVELNIKVDAEKYVVVMLPASTFLAIGGAIQGANARWGVT